MLVWPIELFPAANVRWRLQGVALLGGQSVAGQQRFARTDGGGLWVCEMSGVWIRTKQQIKAVRALEAAMDGGATEIVVPSCDCNLGPNVPIGEGFEGVPHSDGAPFSDGSLYVSDPYNATVGPASLRAVTLTLNDGFGQYIEGGESFSIEHETLGWRRYVIAGVNGDDITIRPPLREAITGDTDVRFCKPLCVMRLINADDFFEAINMGRFSNLSPVFQEAFE